MHEDTHRYFIELQMAGNEDLPRRKEAEVRRAQAEAFVGHVSRWLQEEDLKDKVASIAITALGQVLITCEEDIISRLREDDMMPIAAIRSSVPLAGSLQRVGGW
ncbi:MAG: hypothetical protein PHS57_01350 [Alphaproteobacteria bacterium]|nr:hypothetical protein [Alphaproteobacteria bacterium]